jgi:GntR family transcriptional regulator, transcriptional repressor for pyruvate dehydrogenase complex
MEQGNNLFQGFKLNRKGISSVVVDYMKQLIHEGKYKPGQKLPSERQMADQLKVSRNSVRESYKILEVLGYLTIKHGDGVYVVDKDSNLTSITTSFFLDTSDVHDLFAIRRIIEINGIEWAADRITEKDIQELSSIVDEAMSLMKENANIEQISHLDQKFHLLLAKLSGNSVLLRIMVNLLDLLEEARIQSMDIVGRVTKSVQEHKRIIRALQKGDKTLIKEEMAHHLDSVEKSLLQSITRKKSIN